MKSDGSSSGEQSPSDDPSDDPSNDFSFDESFIRQAEHTELTAAQRERARRQANLQRLLADEAAQRENAEHEYRRFAPGTDQSESGRRRTPRSGRSWIPWRRPSSGRGGQTHTRTSRRGRFGFLKSPLVILGVIVLVGIVALDYFTPNESSSTGDGAIARSLDPLGRKAPRPADWPPKAKQSTEPLGTPGAVPQGGGPHKFLQLQPQGAVPVAYDPCRPIHYVTRPGGPVEGPKLIRESVAAVSGATGLVFVDDGATDEAPSDERAPYQPDRYGERWAPVLITWSDPVESPMLGEVRPESPLTDVAGFAGSQPVRMYDDRAQLVLVTGAVTLDLSDFAAMLTRPEGEDQARAVIQHELGHLVGLGHIDDSSQIMYPQNTGQTFSYQPGDREGLAALGRGECFPDV